MKKKNRKSKVGLWGTLTGVSAGLLAICLIGTGVANAHATTIDHMLNVQKSKIVKNDDASDVDTEYYKSAYAYDKTGEQKLVNDEQALYKRIVEEGTVLLKNDNKALPLSKTASVAEFGNAGPSYLGSLDAEMKNAGFSFNDNSWSFYKNGSKPVAKVSVNENAWSTVKSQPWLSSVNCDAALVVLGRRGGEGDDCAHDPAGTYGDYLALSQEEKDMLKGVKALKDAGKVGKIVVIVSTSNMISGSFINDSQYGIDACLWAGQADTVYGVDGLVALLDGDSNPSGRLVDSVYNDNQLNPSMKNFGSIDANLSGVTPSVKKAVQALQRAWWGAQGDFWQECVCYQEGIYVGYKYAETRYEDYVTAATNAGDFSYANYMAYPFGSGLSYTTWEYDDFAVNSDATNYTVTLSVKNTGATSGKHSVLIYAQSPYTDYDKANGVEKASVKLVGIAKTGVVAPNASEQLTITVPKKELASYDANKAKTYILDAGTYYLTAAGSSHEAENNILAARNYSPSSTASRMDALGNASEVYSFTNPSLDAATYATSSTGYAITNEFDNADPNKDNYCKESNSVKWVSRSDWKETLPTQAISIKYNDDMVEEAKPITYEATAADEAASSMPTLGVDNGLQLASFRGVSYDSDSWTKLLQQMSYSEMVTFITNGSFGMDSLPAVGKPNTTDSNGSMGRTINFTHSSLSGIDFTSTDLRAATYSKDIWRKVGQMTGENMLHGSTDGARATGLYGWSTDIHRTPYGGRNNEYYSEDGVMAGLAVAQETAGVQDEGCWAYTKHFLLNDQESNRHGISTWANEQTIREEYLKPFEYAVTVGHTKALMNSMNRIGMEWVGQDGNAQKNVLRGEFGFDGLIVTDQYETDYQDIIDGLVGGTTLWLDSGTSYNTQPLLATYKDDPVIVNAVVEAVHRDLYVVANSSAMNGIAPTDKVIELTSWWEYALIGVDSFFGIATLAAGAMLVVSLVSKHRDSEKAKEAAATK